LMANRSSLIDVVGVILRHDCRAGHALEETLGEGGFDARTATGISDNASAGSGVVGRGGGAKAGRRLARDPTGVIERPAGGEGFAAEIGARKGSRLFLEHSAGGVVRVPGRERADGGAVALAGRVAQPAGIVISVHELNSGFIGLVVFQRSLVVGCRRGTIQCGSAGTLADEVVAVVDVIDQVPGALAPHIGFGADNQRAFIANSDLHRGFAVHEGQVVDVVPVGERRVGRVNGVRASIVDFAFFSRD